MAHKMHITCKLQCSNVIVSVGLEADDEHDHGDLYIYI